MENALLLIDDDDVFLNTMARSLTRRGETIYTASDGEEALRLISRVQPAKVLLDLNLDGESGLQLLPQLLKLAPNARVILLTGYASIATAVEAIKKGAVDYLCKPATANDVIAAFEKEAVREQHDPSEATPANDDLSPISIPRLEWEHIQRVLKENDGNISATARALGMHRRTLQRKLQKRAPR